MESKGTKKVCPHCGGDVTVKLFVGIRCTVCHKDLKFDELHWVKEDKDGKEKV